MSRLLGCRLREGDLCGIEIELEGGPWPEGNVPLWAPHADGSLRVGKKGHAGIEYVFRNPISIDQAQTALRNLERALNGVEIEFSYRTSVHVHINVSDLTCKQWVSMAVLTLIFEEAFVEVVGPDRAGNKFCLRAKDGEGALLRLRGALRDGDLNDFYRGADYKYAATNLASASRHGTMEFRSMQGNLDVALIHSWAATLMWLRQAAETFADPSEIPMLMSRLGPRAFAEQYLRAGVIRDRVLAINNLEVMMWDGVRIAQDIAYACEWEEPEGGAVAPIIYDEVAEIRWGQAPNAPQTPEDLLRRLGEPPPDRPAPAHPNPADVDF